MKFLEPQWLWGLLILPFWLGWIYFDEGRRRKQFARFAQPKLWQFLSPELNFKLRFRKSLIGLLALAFGFLALARPQWGSHEESIKVSGLDVVLVLDISNSMWAEDVVPSRLQAMKHWVKTLLSTLNGDRVGVVAFAASTAVVSPLTSDLDHVWDTVQILDPKAMQNQGTDIGLALQTATQAIERGAEEVSSGSQAPVASRVVILVSDGEDHENQALVEADLIKKKGIQFYAFGVGTEKGGPIPVRDDAGHVQGFKRDRKGNPIVSAFHSDYLTSLASRAGGKYWSLSQQESEISELKKQMSGLVRGDYSERRFLVYEDRFQFPLAIAVILLIIEISLPVRNLIFAVFLISTFFVPVPVRADALLSAPAPIEGYLETQRGLKAYQRGDFDEAKRRFNSAQALDPYSPELEFNQGVIQLRQGDVDRAVQSFDRAGKLAEKSKKSELRDQALFNLANALEKKGEAKEAIRSYLDAIKSAMASKDPKLEEKARKNLQLVLNEMKKREQKKKEQEKQAQQNQDQKNQSAENQKQKSGEEQKQKENSSQESQKQASTHQQSDEEKRYQETQPGKKQDDFKSQKMTSEDANRVLSELKARERELQEKLQKKNGNQQAQAKDW